MRRQNEELGADGAQEEKTARAAAAYRKSGEGFLNVLNGSLWESEDWVHHCCSHACCDGFDRRKTLLKVIRHLIAFALSSAPTSPEICKWAKLGPALDRFIIAQCVHSSYSVLFVKALEKHTVKGSKPAEADWDHQLQAEISWAKQRGKTAKAVVTFVSDPRLKLRAVCIALALEPIRILMRCFFACSRDGRDKTLTPAISVFANSEASPLLVLLQYCSAFCSAASVGRATLVFRLRGARDVDEFAIADAESLVFMGDLIVIFVGWMHRRHWCDFVRFPWKLAVVAHVSARAELQESIWEEWWRRSPWCLDIYFSGKLRLLLTGPREVFDTVECYEFILAWAHSIDLTTAQVEFRHARQKQFCPGKNIGGAFFVAKTMNSEAMHCFER